MARNILTFIREESIAVVEDESKDIFVYVNEPPECCIAIWDNGKVRFKSWLYDNYEPKHNVDVDHNGRQMTGHRYERIR